MDELVDFLIHRYGHLSGESWHVVHLCLGPEELNWPSFRWAFNCEWDQDPDEWHGYDPSSEVPTDVTF